MKRMLVIGIGSLVMTDDGIGARVAGSLQSRLEAQGISVLIGETDVHCCLDAIRPDDYLIVIDSAMRGQEPGRIDIISLKDAIKIQGKLHSQHDFSLVDAVSLSFPDIQGCLIGIEAAEVGFGFGLSDALEERFERICENVLRVVVELKEAAKYA